MEFLVKNGSERVIDDARSHLSLLKMLRQFHYIDQNGKDQGINVRNRSKELTDLLSDVDKIRSERKKARQTRNKYTGVEGGVGVGIGSGSSGRYGGFGSESGGAGAGYGGATRGVYGDGGGFGGETHEEYDEGGRRGGAERFEEYDEFDDGGAQAQPGRRQADTRKPSSRTPKKAEPAKPKEPEVDLFDFGDEPAAPAMSFPAPSNGTASSSILTPPSSTMSAANDDDFDDFQSATPAAPAPAPAPAPLAAPAIPKPNYTSVSTAAPSMSTQYAQPTPQPAAAQRADFSNIFSTTSQPTSKPATPSASSAFSPPPQAQKPTSYYQPTGPNYFTSVQANHQQQQQQHPVGNNTPSSVSSPSTTGTAKKPASGDAFASLLGGSGMQKSSGSPAQKGLTMADMAKQKSQAGLYGANAPSMPSQPPAAGSGGRKAGTRSSGLDDLLG